MQYNPRNYVNLDFEQSTGRFKGFFISFKSCIDGFNHIRTLLFLDGTFLKERFKGNLLAARGKDGNKGLFPLAFAIVDFETIANWTWFLQHLTKVVSSARTLTFVFDRNAGLLESFPTVFPSAHHAYCLQHLQANLRDKLRWVDNRGKRYGEMTSNAAESFNKWILDARNYPITSQTNEDIYEVYSFPTVLIDVGKRSCSCFQWQLNEFPCAHAVVAIQNNGRDFSTCVEQFFTIDQYKTAYSGYIQPIPTVDKSSFSEDSFIIYPPTVKRPQRRPKKNRIPFREEKLS
ncbi:uncharacterized protein LOC114282111 [Camellia sinensis]|uniref:uncharacterized protein LOC114282111 n=1 Tax=Camellia sinensis TaxID=4442 RepID=UPI001036289A|nr:uncharacterized protein LOC114282111 [Camellia sinensis]